MSVANRLGKEGHVYASCSACGMGGGETQSLATCPDLHMVFAPIGCVVGRRRYQSRGDKLIADFSWRRLSNGNPDANPGAKATAASREPKPADAEADRRWRIVENHGALKSAMPDAG